MPDPVAASQASDEMDSQGRTGYYVEELDKMWDSHCTTLAIDFNHIMQFNDLLQKVISEQYLRSSSPLYTGSPTVRNLCPAILLFPSFNTSPRTMPKGRIAL